MAKNSEHYTEEGVGFVDATRPDAVEEARKRHHLASADPEPERDGTLTGPAHEEKYGLERAEASAAYWRGVGVHPIENRALVPGDEGYDEAAASAGAMAVPPAGDEPETASSKQSNETAAAARPSSK